MIIPISCKCGWKGILEDLAVFLQTQEPWSIGASCSNSRKVVKLKECFDKEEFGEVLSFACPKCAKGSFEIPKEHWNETNKLLLQNILRN